MNAAAHAAVGRSATMLWRSVIVLLLELLTVFCGLTCSHWQPMRMRNHVLALCLVRSPRTLQPSWVRFSHIACATLNKDRVAVGDCGTFFILAAWYVLGHFSKSADQK